LMPACRNCHRCVEACPTGSLRSDRFLVEASRCLTYFNEREGAFPGWVETDWHNAVFGCMRCQEVCPANRNLIERSGLSPLAFNESEAAAILQKTPLTELGPATRTKLHELCMDDDYQLLARNLGALVSR
jgi:epoxyqueuosine reductase